MVNPSDALAWRLDRHALSTADGMSVADVADRVIALRAWPSHAAELIVGTRLAVPGLSTVDAALASGEVIRSYAFGGGSYVFSPRTAAEVLTARTASRIWETRRWQQQAGIEIHDWRPLREAVRELLASGPMTRAEISDGISRITALRPLAHAALGLGADTLYKPLHWWGDISFGPSRGGTATFRLAPVRPAELDVDEGGRRSVRTYLHSYAPATLDNLAHWLTGGLGVPRRRVSAWIADLGDEVATIDVDGVRSLVLAADADAVATARMTDHVRLLPAYDPWVFGPGSADTRITPPEWRGAASNGSSLVIVRGRVAGTWRVRAGAVTLTHRSTVGGPPGGPLLAEVARLSALRGEVLRLELDDTVDGSRS